MVDWKDTMLRGLFVGLVVGVVLWLLSGVSCGVRVHVEFDDGTRPASGLEI